MDRLPVLFVVLPLLAFFGCDAPTPDPISPEPPMPGAPDIGGPNDPVPIEFPFMPFPDGYQFGNFGGAADWELFLSVYGDQVNLWSILDWGFFINDFAPWYGNGQCYGFAVTAGMFYRGIFGPQPGFFEPGATETFDIVQHTRGGGALALDEDIERHIEKYFYYQLDPELRSQFVVADSPEDSYLLIEAAKAAQADGWTDPLVLCFFGPTVAHCVNLVGVLGSSTDATFWLYNNNAPFDPATNNPGFRQFRVTPEDFILEDGSRTVTLASVIPVSIQERDHLEKWWGPMDQEDFWKWVSTPMDPDMFVIHIDDADRWLGRTAAAEFDDIPDAYRVRAATGNLDAEWPEPEFYYLPPGDYTIDLSNSTTGSLDYRLLAGDALFSLASSAVGESLARVTSVKESRSFAVETQNLIESLSVKVAQALSQEEERAMEISGLTLPVEGRIRISPEDGATAFRLELEGVEAIAADLTITEASPSGVLSLALAGVQIVGGDALEVEPWDWSRLDRMPVFVIPEAMAGPGAWRALNVTGENLDAVLEDMVASGALPNQGIARSIRQQTRLSPLTALRNHLESLVAEGTISEDTACQILALAEAAQG